MLTNSTVTLDDFLKALSNTYKTLPNTRETWSRLGKRDDFRELAFEDDSEKDKFLAEWVQDNPYSDI